MSGKNNLLAVATLLLGALSFAPWPLRAQTRPNPPPQICVNNKCATTPDPSGGSSSGGQVKWNPGHYMQSVNVNGSPAPYGNGRNAAEMRVFAADHSHLQGYMALYSWDMFENKTKDGYDFSAIVADFNYLQSVAPGARFCISIAAYKNSNVTRAQLATFRPDGIPAYILNDPGTYGAGPPGNNGAGGYGLSSYNTSSGSWGYANAALWRPAVMDRLIALFTALANSTALPPYRGVQYTFDTHPLIEAVGDWGPTDLDMRNNPALNADYDGGAWTTQWLRRSAPMSAAFQHTSVFLMPGFGATGGTESDQSRIVASMYQNRVALSCTDVYAPQSFTYAQNYFVGNLLIGIPKSDSFNSTGGGFDYRGKMPSMPTVQGYDYFYGNPPHARTPQQTQDIRDVAVNTLRASHIFWTITDDTYVIPGYWNTNILPILNLASNQTVQTRPLVYQ
jgi:hypothetical protein